MFDKDFLDLLFNPTEEQKKQVKELLEKLNKGEENDDRNT